MHLNKLVDINELCKKVNLVVVVVLHNNHTFAVIAVYNPGLLVYSAFLFFEIQLTYVYTRDQFWGRGRGPDLVAGTPVYRNALFSIVTSVRALPFAGRGDVMDIFNTRSLYFVVWSTITNRLSAYWLVLRHVFTNSLNSCSSDFKWTLFWRAEVTLFFLDVPCNKCNLSHHIVY